MLHPRGDKHCKRRFHSENLVFHLHFNDNISPVLCGRQINLRVIVVNMRLGMRRPDHLAHIIAVNPNIHSGERLRIDLGGGRTVVPRHLHESWKIRDYKLFISTWYFSFHRLPSEF